MSLSGRFFLGFVVSLSVLAAGCYERMEAPFDGGTLPTLDAGSNPDAPMMTFLPDAPRDAARRDAGRDANLVPGGCPEEDLGSEIGRPVRMTETTTATARYEITCGSGGESPSRHYRWTAPADGTFVVDLQGSSFDTVLTLLEEDCSTVIACNDDSSFGLASRLDVTLSRGDSIIITVSGYGGSSGSVVLNISQPEHANEIGLCDNAEDDDLDGALDCSDWEDCGEDPACIELDCSNGLDDDGDFAADCVDWDCISRDPACTETLCTDTLDNDGDGLIDCTDDDCRWRDPACVETICTDGLDNDMDGDADCRDFDCDGTPGCIELDCVNGIDDDGDGLVDCSDFDCSRTGVCGGEMCETGRDEDFDGLIDCQDGDCDFDPACEGQEHCTNGTDDDGDGMIDCTDNHCIVHPWCGFGPTPF